MRRRESLVGQVVAVNVLLVVAVLFAASAAAGLNLAVSDQRLRFGALAISILLLLIINMILLRRRFSPLETLIARLDAARHPTRRPPRRCASVNAVRSKSALVTTGTG